VVTDIAGGIALDPLTYVTFGASALADDVARQALTPAVANKFGGLTDDAVNTLDNVVGEITEKTVNEALPIVQKRLGQEGAEAFYSNLLASGNLGQTGALNILGKKVSESPK
jgi:predicted molibdopterin-dependent oxidoreductase YjgC